MAVAETRRGAVFRHVPRVHYGVGAVVGGGAGVDLAGGGGAAAGGGAARVETAAGRCQWVEMRLRGELSEGEEEREALTQCYPQNRRRETAHTR